MATILVGPEKEKFVVHRALLCSKSVYFNKALFGSFKESETGIVKLEDVSSVLFRIFVTWIYEDKVRYTAAKYSYSVEKYLEYDSDEYEDDDSEDEEQGFDEDAPFTWPCRILVKLHVFADRFDIRALRASMIDVLCERLDKKNTTLPKKVCCYVWSHTSEHSSLRKFVVHRLAYHTSFNGDTLTFWKELPPDLTIAVLMTVGRRIPSKLCNPCYERGLRHNGIDVRDVEDLVEQADIAPYERDLCFYHEHTDEEERKTCRIRREEDHDSSMDG
ncbi:hypothetical protein D6D28_01911 [Aureobasidium pullulans]|uniref:BTB domain-containing protein n=1 Tax=Aureobasidium pullulans TaxID=5580 RepID=A0A4S8SVR2_AURPU|nr:hypothetical protein D6D28_01911 [Aureobasidium pullulans]